MKFIGNGFHHSLIFVSRFLISRCFRTFAGLINNNQIMVFLKMENVYESPIIVMREIDFEGILCASPGNESVGEEEGNGGFM